VIHQNTGSTISHGSKFRDKETLRAILGNHPYYNDFNPFLSRGVDFVFTEEITEEDRMKELEAKLERGNHKSAHGQEETLSKLLAKHTWGYGPTMRDNLPVHTGTRRKPRCQKEAAPRHEALG
jgi:hypothetical protein